MRDIEDLFGAEKDLRAAARKYAAAQSEEHKHELRMAAREFAALAEQFEGES